MGIELSNARLRLVDEGPDVADASTSPCLFLHGNPDTADLWHGVIARLKPRHRCLAPDLPGFGGSIVTGELDCSLESMAGLVDEMVETLGVETPLNLAVHDFGGPYGLSWAIRHPRKVRRIAIIDSLYFADYRWHFWARVWRTPLLGELSMLLMNRWIFARELRRGGPGLSAEHVRRTYAGVTPAMKRMVLQLYRATDPEAFRGWEERMLALTSRVPTTVLWGAKDPYIPARYANRFGTRHVRVFPDRGHWLPVEASSEVAEELMGWFSASSEAL